MNQPVPVRSVAGNDRAPPWQVIRERVAVGAQRQRQPPGQIRNRDLLHPAVVDTRRVHPGRFENVVPQKVLKGNACNGLHDLCQQAVAGVGVLKLLARSKGWLLAALTEETDDHLVSWDRFFLLGGLIHPVHVIRKPAGVVQQVADRDALIGDFREEFRDLVLERQQPSAPQQHHRRRSELLADGRKVKETVLAKRNLVLQIAKTDCAFRHDLAVLGVKPGSVETALFKGVPGEGIQNCFLIHARPPVL